MEHAKPPTLPNQEPPPVPSVRTGNVFSKHPVWWLVLVILCLLFAVAFPNESSGREIFWAYVVGSVAGMFFVGFVFGGIAYVVSLFTRKRMTSQQFMSIFTFAIAMALGARVVVAIYEKKSPDNVQREQAQLLKNVELFESSVQYVPSPSHGEAYVYVNQIQGRVRNRSSKTVASLTVKISVFSADNTLIDTEAFTLRDLRLATGDVKSFSERIYIDQVPKGFSLAYSITSGEFK